MACANRRATVLCGFQVDLQDIDMGNFRRWDRFDADAVEAEIERNVRISAILPRKFNSSTTHRHCWC